MIWFDWMPERRLTADEIRRALAGLVSCAYHDVGVIDDISDLRDLPATCLVAVQSDGGYGQQLSIYLNDDAGARVRTVSRVDAAEHLARILGTRVLVPDDDSENPYAMICLAADGRRERVTVDSMMFDEHGVVRIVG